MTKLKKRGVIGRADQASRGSETTRVGFGIAATCGMLHLGCRHMVSSLLKEASASNLIKVFAKLHIGRLCKRRPLLHGKTVASTVKAA